MIAIGRGKCFEKEWGWGLSSVGFEKIQGLSHGITTFCFGHY
jgi:hypothetical protein